MEENAAGEAEKLLVLADLSGFHRGMEKLSETDTCGFLRRFYERIEKGVEEKNGRVVKFIGDAALAVYATESLPEKSASLKKMKNEIDAWLPATGFPESTLRICVHLGTVAEARVGRNGWYDVFGRAERSFSDENGRFFTQQSSAGSPVSGPPEQGWQSGISF